MMNFKGKVHSDLHELNLENPQFKGNRNEKPCTVNFKGRTDGGLHVLNLENPHFKGCRNGRPKCKVSRQTVKNIEANIQKNMVEKPVKSISEKDVNSQDSISYERSILKTAESLKEHSYSYPSTKDAIEHDVNSLNSILKNNGNQISSNETNDLNRSIKKNRSNESKRINILQENCKLFMKIGKLRKINEKLKKKVERLNDEQDSLNKEIQSSLVKCAFLRCELRENSNENYCYEYSAVQTFVKKAEHMLNETKKFMKNYNDTCQLFMKSNVFEEKLISEIAVLNKLIQLSKSRIYCCYHESSLGYLSWKTISKNFNVIQFQAMYCMDITCPSSEDM